MRAPRNSIGCSRPSVRSTMRLIATLFTLLFSLSACSADARTPLHWGGDRLIAAATADELEIAGLNPTQRSVTLVVRIDDRRAPGYADRVNEERVLPPGAFRFRLNLAALRTPAGRRLDRAGLTRLILFTASKDPEVEIQPPRFISASALPNGARGWDLGAQGGPLFPGFTALHPDSPEVSGRHLRVIERPSGDALIRDGLAGIDRIELPLPNGQWRVSLWIEELGEWEYLPHDLERSIWINGRSIYSRRLTPSAWIEQRYLAGQDGEAIIDGDPWELFGARRGGHVQALLQVTAGQLRIEPRGLAPSARYLAALLIEPADSTLAADQVRDERARRFRETWRVDGASFTPAGEASRSNLPLTLSLHPFRWPFESRHAALVSGDQFDDGVLFASAAGGRVLIDVVVHAQKSDPTATLEFKPPSRNGVALSAHLRWGHWRFGRPRASSTLLVPNANHLRGGSDTLRLDSALPRRLNLEIPIPADAASGRYRGQLQLKSRGHSARLPLEIELIDLRLPPLDRPIGAYLEQPPWLAWFKRPRAERSSVAACDLQRLRQFGLTAIAPPLTTPLRGRELDTADELTQVASAGFTRALAYAPVKRLLARVTPSRAGQLLGRVNAQLERRGVAAPAWSIADEPSNTSGHSVGHRAAVRRLLELAQQLRYQAPALRLAAHLNHPEDRAYLKQRGLLDLALINSGYRLDAEAITAARAAGVEIWLYNLAEPRWAAGLYLWRVEADGYLQWHARMPTADPFDPTDGREADFHLLYPELDPGAVHCSEPAEIDARLLAIAAGIEDLRWIRWLESAAEYSTAAADLLLQLSAEIPLEWSRLRKQISQRWGGDADAWADALRQRIQAVARRVVQSTDDNQTISGNGSWLTP